MTNRPEFEINTEYNAVMNGEHHVIAKHDGKRWLIGGDRQGGAHVRICLRVKGDGDWGWFTLQGVILEFSHWA